jgi:DNA-binding transcriptional LysR family regulator
MDIQLARTFLAITADGNFGSAATSLYVTQSAVSLRVKRLEAMLGQRLFDRSKAGVKLTSAGRQFERFAISLVRIWEEARHQVAVPEGFNRTFIIGGQYSLLPKLVMRWLDQLETMLPDCAFRVEAGMPERMMRLLLEGALDMAVMYTPQLRPGFQVEQLFAEELVLVTADPDFGPELDERYVFMDWGPEFIAAHAVAYQGRQVPRTTFAIGSLGLNSIIRRKRAAYFPARVVRDELRAGLLHLVPDAPTFAYPCYVVFHDELDEQVKASALQALRNVVDLVDSQQGEIIGNLNVLSDEAVAQMGILTSAPKKSA